MSQPRRFTCVYRPATEVTARSSRSACVMCTPNASATASAMTALDRLARPGSARSSGVARPVGSITSLS